MDSRGTYAKRASGKSARSSMAPLLSRREAATHRPGPWQRSSEPGGNSMRVESQTPRVAEQDRLALGTEVAPAWKLWGPYLSERQWGTVREDYSAYGNAWEYFPHEHARSRAYRWGEDGLMGFSDIKQRLCLGLALWNTRDPILKERMFGLTSNQGNHGEDVKEIYYYLDGTPTHSYMRMLYKYPQAAFPYEALVAQNA